MTLEQEPISKPTSGIIISLLMVLVIIIFFNFMFFHLTRPLRVSKSKDT